MQEHLRSEDKERSSGEAGKGGWGMHHARMNVKMVLDMTRASRRRQERKNCDKQMQREGERGRRAAERCGGIIILAAGWLRCWSRVVTSCLSAAYRK